MQRLYRRGGERLSGLEDRMTSHQQKKPSPPPSSRPSPEELRAKNVRLGLILLTIVLVFFFGVMVKTKLLGGPL